MSGITEIQPLSFYKSITILPLSKFIDCMVDGNLYALVISGTLTDTRELQETWADILQEYSDAIGSNEHKLYLSLYREISLLEIEYAEINHLVDALRALQSYISFNDPEGLEDILAGKKILCTELNRLLKISCKFNHKDNASFQQELDKCQRRSKSIRINLDLKLIAFAEIQKKNAGKGVKMDRSYFDSILITISDHAKYEISETITVSKYCERIRRYNHYCESQKSKK